MLLTKPESHSEGIFIMAFIFIIKILYRQNIKEFSKVYFLFFKGLNFAMV